MEELFLKLLNMSITASWLSLAVIVFRIFLKKSPKWISVLLWGFVGLRLVCPFSIESVLSLIPSTETVPPDIIYSKTPQIYSGISAFNTVVNPVISDTFTPDVSASANPLQIITSIASAVWVIGMAVMFVYTVFSFLRVKRRVREAVLFEDDLWTENSNIWICDNIATPFILGIIKPRIYLPSDMNDKDRELVIAHEKAHIKRRDHWWKPLGFLLLAVYWFNPVLWAAYILLCKDIELACDEKVMEEMGSGIKKSYSNALINCSVSRKTVAACPLAFGEVGVKSRIKSVLNYKKPAFWVVLVSVILSIVLAVCFLTDPAGVSLTKLNPEEDHFDTENIFSNVNSLTVTYDDEQRFYNDQSNINRYIATLDKIKVSEKPVSKSRAEDRTKEFVIKINGNTEIIFEEGFASIWIDNKVKPSYSYKILNKDTAEELILDFKHADYDILNATVEGYYLTIAQEGVMSIEVSTPSSSGGCQRADGKPFEEGDRVYLETLNGFENLKGVTVKALGESGEEIYSFSVDENEEIKEYDGEWKIEYSEGYSATDIDTAVSYAILKLNSEVFYAGECAAEGHIILGAEEKGDKVTAYVLERYSSFGFENGWFIERGGHSTACVMTFRKESDVYTFIDAEYVRDGADLPTSVKRLFPKMYEKRVLSPTDEDNESMWQQCVAYAEKYLKEIGREAEIGTYGDIQHVLLTDLGVSVEVSNALSGLKTMFNTGEVGTYETLEDGVRYIYRTSYIESENIILYTKENYETGGIAEKLEVNSLTGEVVYSESSPEYAKRFNAKVLEVKENQVLVEALENEEIRKVGDRFWVNTDINPDVVIPDLYEGLYITIIYDGIIETTDPGLIGGTSAIYLYADVNYVGEKASAAEPSTTTVTAEEKHSEDLVYSYIFYNGEKDTSYISLSPSSNTFFFSLSLLSSYAPSGTYEEKDGYVILDPNDKENKYVFKRDGVNLVFVQEKSSQVPKYKYSADDTEFQTCIPDKAVFEFSEKHLPYIDKTTADIDGDGVYEDCVLSYGPTSGLFTVVFTASAYGKVKYENTFNSSYSTLSFKEKDGKTCIFATDGYPDTDKEVYFDINVKDGNIVLSSGDESFAYWGEQGTS